jgi:hypothetical protein
VRHVREVSVLGERCREDVGTVLGGHEAAHHTKSISFKNSSETREPAGQNVGGRHSLPVLRQPHKKKV